MNARNVQIIRINYKFRLYPSQVNEEKLLSVLEKCRLVYNFMVCKLKKQDKPNRYILQNLLPELKNQIPELKDVYSKVLQYEVYKLFSNFKACKDSEKLRYICKEDFRAIHYNQSGYKIIFTNTRLDRLYLSKIGNIPIRIHRSIKGNIKQIVIKKYPSGKWFANIFVELENIIQKNEIRSIIGMDLGIKHFITDSHGKKIENPQYLEQNLKRLKRQYKRLQRKQKNSKNMRKMKIKLARLHEKIVNQRKDFVHKLSKYYVNRYDLIVLENLKIKDMIQDSFISRSISDVAWYRFAQNLSYKTKRKGKTLIKIDPRNTSKIYKYGKLDRDYNASINILEKGLMKIGMGQTEFTPVDIRPIQELVKISASQVVESGSFLNNNIILR